MACCSAPVHGLPDSLFGPEVHYNETTGLMNGSIRIAVDDDDLLGEGGFAEVRPASLPGAEAIVAKMIDKGDENHHLVIEEARVCLQLRHPNIVACFGAAQTSGYAVLFFERIEGCTLAQWAYNYKSLYKYNPLEEDIQPLMWQIFQALHYLQTKCLVHADLYENNVMIAEKNKAILIDFGWVKTFNPEKPGMERKSDYAYPPEMVDKQLGIDHKCDIFLCASMFYEVLFNKGPFGVVVGVNVPDQLNIVRAGMCEEPWTVFVGPERSSQPLRDLLHRCLAYDANDRPCAADALRFAWFDSGNWTKLVPKLREYKSYTPLNHPSQLERTVVENLSCAWGLPKDHVIDNILS
ncbi:uncharacterized protein LOC135825121 [Sycon ciliatum]|uniref:uncharacterized protein LOC135825121 n=1 Tax=Sycon ciliatum TaxID=27933 RepID=UPI0031F61545